MNPPAMEPIGGRHHQKAGIGYIFRDLTMRLDRLWHDSP